MSRTPSGKIMDAAGISDRGKRRGIAGVHARMHGPGKGDPKCVICVGLGLSALSERIPKSTATEISIKSAPSATQQSEKPPLEIDELRSLAGSNAALKEIADHLRVQPFEIEKFLWDTEHKKWQEFQEEAKSGFAAATKLAVGTKVLEGKQPLPAEFAMNLLGQEEIAETEDQLVRGTECPRCSRLMRMSTEELLEERKRLLETIDRPTGIRIAEGCTTLELQDATPEKIAAFKDGKIWVPISKDADSRQPT